MLILLLGAIVVGEVALEESCVGEVELGKVPNIDENLSGKCKNSITKNQCFGSDQINIRI